MLNSPKAYTTFGNVADPEKQQIIMDMKFEVGQFAKDAKMIKWKGEPTGNPAQLIHVRAHIMKPIFSI